MTILNNLKYFLWKKKSEKKVKKAKPSKMVFYEHGQSKELDQHFKKYPIYANAYEKRLVHMTPEQFLRATYLQRTSYIKKHKISYKDYKEMLANEVGGSMGNDPKEIIRILKEKLKDKEQRVDTPYLRLFKGLPVGHEGRHRALAAKEVGLKKIPVNIIYKKEDEISKDVSSYADMKKIYQEMKKRMGEK